MRLVSERWRSVRQRSTGRGTAQEHTAAMRKLERLFPDPDVSSLVLRPSQHRLSADIDEAELTPS